MGVQFDATQIDHPGEAGRVIDDDLLRGSARRERQGDGSQPGWPLGGCSLLIKGLCLGPVDETLENNRTIPDSGERARRNRQIVAYEVELRDTRLRREVQLAGMRYLDFASLDREHLAGVFFCH